MQILDNELFDLVSNQAKKSPRLRQNYNLHQDYAEPCQRLLNALEPGTYIRPHRHLTPPKPECFLAMRGRMAVVLFCEKGAVEKVVEVSPVGPVYGLDISVGSWHTIVALEAGSLFFECKPGPYEPLSDKDWAQWAPAEGGSGVEDYLSQLEMQVQQQLGE